MASLPFHISEPFLRKLVDLPIDDAVLVLGEQMARRIETTDPDDPGFSRTGAMVQTFFETRVAKELKSRSFTPEPSTDAEVLILTPRDPEEFRGNPKGSILKRLFKTEDKRYK